MDYRVWGYIGVITIIILAFLMGIGVGYDAPRPHIVMGQVQLDVIEEREKVKCVFDKPIKHLTLVNHWYDDWEELNADYILMVGPASPGPVWGWSSCVWQPTDDWAACDVYAVAPTYVNADMAMDTLGHELFHGSCGSFHE